MWHIGKQVATLQLKPINITKRTIATTPLLLAALMS